MWMGRVVRKTKVLLPLVFLLSFALTNFLCIEVNWLQPRSLLNSQLEHHPQVKCTQRWTNRKWIITALAERELNSNPDTNRLVWMRILPQKPLSIITVPRMTGRPQCRKRGIPSWDIQLTKVSIMHHTPTTLKTPFRLVCRRKTLLFTNDINGNWFLLGDTKLKGDVRFSLTNLCFQQHNYTMIIHMRPNVPMCDLLLLAKWSPTRWREIGYPLQSE